MADPSIINIIGPTASGKSALAMALARALDAHILSVDSMQVYRQLDIGTAKPTAQERAQVPHHLVDVANPDEAFSVKRFVQSAEQAIAETHAAGRSIIAAGGTPLYYKALFDGIFEGPSADENVRAALAERTLDELHDELTIVDPASAWRIHRNDRKRLVRALEVYELTGKPISQLQTEWEQQNCRHPAVWFGIHWQRDELSKRINARVKAMLDAGWLDEVRTLLYGYGEEALTTSGKAAGYAELIDYLKARVSWEDAVEQIKISTRQLSRRQIKWFRRFADVHWIAGDAPPEAQLAQVRSVIALKQQSTPE